MTPSALARKWCKFHRANPIWNSAGMCECAQIIAAVREALEMVEKIARKHKDGSGCRICEDRCGDNIAAAIAALREGRDETI